jgi:heterodisulfide reductase subunit A
MPRYVNTDLCTACGTCVEKCPSTAPDEFDLGKGERKAIYQYFPQGIPASVTIDPEHCIYFQKGKCRICEKVCGTKAIDFEQKSESVTLTVSSIILAPGFRPFDPRTLHQYGYGTLPNVCTSMEFERFLSASGPTGGRIRAAASDSPPEKIAFLQCIGSRDLSIGRGYCSSACCMYATKEAIIAKEHEPDLDITIFAMDVRSFGKDFDRFIDRAKEQHGIRYEYAGVSDIEENSEKGTLLVHYEKSDGHIVEEEFDIAVLSVGMDRPREYDHLAKVLGLELDSYGFCRTPDFEPVATTKPGVFVCGLFSGPKDIPESVVQASCAASRASIAIPPESKIPHRKEFPPEKDVSGEEPRIGVIVCHCGVNIAGVVDVQKVVEEIQKVPGVVHAEESLYACSTDAQQVIADRIAAHDLNRVVVAACTPRTHEPLFRETLAGAGLNPYLFEMANIRDQCSWVHSTQPAEATQRAIEQLRMTVAKAALLQPLESTRIEVEGSAVVIGGGIAGMTAALELAKNGFPVHLIEREARLGGNTTRLVHIIGNTSPAKKLKSLAEEIEKEKLVSVYLESEIAGVNGYVGNFTVTLSRKNGKKRKGDIRAGVVIVATGAEEYKPAEYLYGEDERVLTQLELEARLEKGDIDAGTVVMIQCVGSRNDTRPYCSRVCCLSAVKNALKLREQNPDMNIYILYRDMMTYGLYEDYYTLARQKGIIFLRQPDMNAIGVEKEGASLRVTCPDELLDGELVIEPDYIVLSTGIVPNRGNPDLQQMLKVPLNADGYFLEAHVKLRPVEFATDGIFVCGTAHSPKTIEESIAQAGAAASRASIILSQDMLTADGAVSAVDREKCIGCRLCEYLCPYNAAVVEETDEGFKARIEEVLCKGCGVCGASCPRNAIVTKHFNDEQIAAQICAPLGVE